MCSRPGLVELSDLTLKCVLNTSLDREVTGAESKEETVVEEQSEGQGELVIIMVDKGRALFIPKSS